ncbi:MAG: slipin family protein [Acidobacteria bacterium]|nr:MAG: slipin family protein [Acidobacteriota bacterium]MCE7958374.1 slipin family protein [Acidobacteria bacterium ACB2]
MVPITIPTRSSKKKEAEESQKSPLETASEKKERKREKSADARRYVSEIGVLAANLSVAAGIAVTALLRHPVPFFLSLLVGAYLLFALKVARQWERAVVLRLGKFTGLKGPGLFAVIPVVDVVSHLVDQRLRVSDVTAESALTRDTVPVNVDAIVFWTVWDARKSVLEVADYSDAVLFSAQTALREAIGKHQLAEMITERDQLGKQLQAILDEKTNTWGITVNSVEIRDVKIPPDLEDAMSRQAQAERERQARIILGTAETEIASRFVTAGTEYEGKPLALHLRAMNMLYEAIKEKGSMVIVPSSAVETMGLGGLSGITALSGPAGTAPAGGKPAV